MVTRLASRPDPVDRAATARALAAVEHTDDVVEYTIRCLLALAPGFSRAAADAAERQVREVFGRSSPYVAVRRGDGRSARNDAIRRDHQAGERIPLLVRRYGLCERQILRILSTGSG